MFAGVAQADDRDERHPDPVTVTRERWALTALLAATAVLYLWNLAATDFGNTFYAAAAQAGSQSWSAWFFGSLDANNFITVDKPPASLWVTGLSVRLFGMNSWAVLVPQALMGVASVAVLYFTARRAFTDPRQGAAAGLLAATVLACTPAAALMFRFNNPDALLVLLLTAAAYCTMRAVPAASWRWLAAAGALMGFAFLTKMLQGFLVLPGFALAYALFAPTTWNKRAVHLVGAAAAVVVAAGWWVAAVQVVPTTTRPYIGGSTDNTVLDLALGYNGISRIVGRHRESDMLSDWHGVSTFGSRTGMHRLFTGEMGNEIAWLLLAALFAVAFGVYLAARRMLHRDELCALTMWGCWLAVTGVVFSFMDGTVHPYYTVALAPAVAALIGLGGLWAWRRRSNWDGRFAIAAMVALAAVPSIVLLRHNDFGAIWSGLIAALGVAAVACVFLPHPRVVGIAAAVGVVAAIAGAAAVLHRHRGDPPSRFDTLRRAVVDRDRTLDVRRGGQQAVGCPAQRHPHAVVGGDQRITVGRGAGDRLRHLGDGGGRLEHRPGTRTATVHRRCARRQSVLLHRRRPRRDRGGAARRGDSRPQSEHLAHPRDRRLGCSALPGDHHRGIHGLPTDLTRRATMRT